MSERKLKVEKTNGRAMKQWTTLKGENSWTMFKVIAELVDGFEHSEVDARWQSIFANFT